MNSTLPTEYGKILGDRLNDELTALIANQIPGRCKDCTYLFDGSQGCICSRTHTRIGLYDYCGYFMPRSTK